MMQFLPILVPGRPAVDRGRCCRRSRSRRTRPCRGGPRTGTARTVVGDEHAARRHRDMVADLDQVGLRPEERGVHQAVLADANTVGAQPLDAAGWSETTIISLRRRRDHRIDQAAEHRHALRPAAAASRTSSSRSAAPRSSPAPASSRPLKLRDAQVLLVDGERAAGRCGSSDFDPRHTPRRRTVHHPRTTIERPGGHVVGLAARAVTREMPERGGCVGDVEEVARRANRSAARTREPDALLRSRRSGARPCRTTGRSPCRGPPGSSARDHDLAPGRGIGECVAFGRELGLGVRPARHHQRPGLAVHRVLPRPPMP